MLISVWGCHQPRTSETIPETEIVRQLSLRRIVMMGDFAHDYPLPYHGLIATLNAWLARVTTGESNQYHLVLFLEEDRQEVGLLNQYLSSGDLNPLLDFLLPSTSIERLEFYADLREVVTRIDSVNKTAPPSEKISLEVQGPEAANILDPARIDSSRRASLLYFVRERDSLTAMNVVGYLKDHPENKGLMFFGNAHLLKRLMRKDYSGVLDPVEGMGMFLGYYLKRAFGEAQVFTISQVARTQTVENLDGVSGRDVMYFAEDVPWKDLPPNDDNLFPENYDAFIIRDGTVIHNHPLRCVFSRRVTDAALKRLEYSEPHRFGAMGNRVYMQALNTLTFLYDTTFSTDRGWKRWCRRHRFEGMPRLVSKQFQERFEGRSSLALGTPDISQYIDEIINLGYDPRVGSQNLTRDEWKQCLASQWPQILILNAIAVYWIGEPDEQIKAKKYLVDFTSENFQRPDQYLKWWRKRFFGAAY